MSAEQIDEYEVLDGELVPEQSDTLAVGLGADAPRELQHLARERLPVPDAAVAVHAAALVAGGFLAGAATMALLRRYGQPRPERPLAGAAAQRQLPGETRAYLVSVRRLA